MMKATAFGIPEVDHVGVTVPDLDEATAFFTEVLGFRKSYRLGPFSAEDDWMSENIGTLPSAKMLIQVLEGASATKLELFGFEASAPGEAPLKRDAPGAASIGLSVDDLESVVSKLKSAGCEILGETKEMPEGPLEGLRWIYARAPWGLLLFLSHRKT